MGALKFEQTPLTGLILIEPVFRQDERGLFCRTFCRDEFIAEGLPGEFVQSSTSYNRIRGIVRGLHYQIGPGGSPLDAAEGKLVRCTRGAIFDVAVDIRPDSPTFGRWHGVELSADNRRSLYIPPGFAHGFQALAESEVYYQITCSYDSDLQRGIRWDDPRVAVAWPVKKSLLSPRDQALPELAALGK
jgi:dTDP-4-dehydrorhamnose 3,5-epimerase